MTAADITGTLRNPPGRPTTVVHLITTLTQGGAERALSELAPRPQESLAAAERHVVISLVPGGMFADLIASRGIEVRSLGMRPGRDLVRGSIRFLRILRELRPDFVISWLYHAMFLAHLTRVPARLVGAPSRQAWMLQGSLHTTKGLPWHTRVIIWSLARRSCVPDIIAINSATGRAHHENYGYRPQRWAAVPSGCDTDVFCPGAEDRTSVREALGVPPDALVAIAVARDHPQKDHATMLQAMASAAHDVPSLELILVGTNTEHYAQDSSALVRVHGLGERTDVVPLLRAADVVISSSITEGMPNALLEAMATGLPAVVTDVGDCRQAVGDAGWVVDPQDPGAIARALVILSSTPVEERARLADRARQHIIDNFGVRRARDAYRALWRPEETDLER